MKVRVQLTWSPTHGTEHLALADAQPINLETKTLWVKYSMIKSDIYTNAYEYDFFSLKIAIVPYTYSTESHHREHQVGSVRHLMV